MKVFSSYYDKVSEFPKDEYTFVRVSRSNPPEWFPEAVGEHVDLSDTFGPTPAMLQECHPTKDWETFMPRYKNEILGVQDKDTVLNMLNEIYTKHGNKPLLLLCYEAPPENCHRHLIAEFLEIEIQEL